MRVLSTLGCTSCVATPLGDTAPMIAIDASARATPGAEASVLYKFGMSPLLWALVAGAAGGGGYLLLRRRKKARR